MNEQVAEFITNLATNNKWILYLPLSNIFNDSNLDLLLNVYSLDIPEITVTKTQTPFQGYTVEIPTNTKEISKELSISYLLSERWEQYFVLYDWISKIVKEVGSGANYTKLEELLIPARLYILSAFKQPILEISFEYAYISGLGGVSLSYQEGEDVLTHSFTLTYFYMKHKKL